MVIGRQQQPKKATLVASSRNYQRLSVRNSDSCKRDDQNQGNFRQRNVTFSNGHYEPSKEFKKFREKVDSQQRRLETRQEMRGDRSPFHSKKNTNQSVGRLFRSLDQYIFNQQDTNSYESLANTEDTTTTIAA